MSDELPGKIWFRTTQLRFILRVPRGKILQQAWLCNETGETEWRDVELVEGE